VRGAGLHDHPASGRGEPGNTAGQNVQVPWANPGQSLLRLRRPHSGLANQHDLPVQPRSELFGMLTEQLQRHVIGTGDVCGLEFRAAAHVDDGDRFGVVDPLNSG
jgi:hypothetical protein